MLAFPILLLFSFQGEKKKKGQENFFVRSTKHKKGSVFLDDALGIFLGGSLLGYFSVKSRISARG